MTAQEQRDGAKPLSMIVTVSGSRHPSSNIEYDSMDVVRKYIPNANALHALERFAAGLESGGSAMSIVGPYGSGKSTFGVMLNCLAGPKNDAAYVAAMARIANASGDAAGEFERCRTVSGVHRGGVIRCSVSAKREPVGRTLLRAMVNGAESYFGAEYGKKDFMQAGLLRRLAGSAATPQDAADVISIMSDLAKYAPILLMIDEFGKNIEYFTEGKSDGDLFLLQELAEMSGKSRKMPLHMVTMQHMAFGDYVAGTLDGRMKEWGKIQGRFDTIQFSNSLEHTRDVLSSALPGGTHGYKITEWARSHAGSAKIIAGVNIGADVVESCYPLHPLAVEALPELCSRYGQNERTLLSFVSEGGSGTISRFIDESTWTEGGTLPTMGLDALYDYFISGTNRTGSTTSRLVEIDTIIRDIPGLGESRLRTLKSIGVLNLIGRSGRLRASMGMLCSMGGVETRRDVEYLESKSIITYRRHADEYRIWHGTDVNISAKLDLWRKAKRDMPFHELMGSAMVPDPVIAARHGIRTGTVRIFQSFFGDPDGRVVVGDGYDGAVVYGISDTKVPEGVLAAVARCQDELSLREAAIEVAALKNVLQDEEVENDRIAVREIGERLAASEAALAEEFGKAYCHGMVEWEEHYPGESISIASGMAGSVVSGMCDKAYNRSPVIRNEMINRNVITGQGSTARNRMLSAIIRKSETPFPWFDNWSAERAVYEAIIWANSMHYPDGGLKRSGGRMNRVWGAVASMLQKSKGLMVLTEIYDVWKGMPYGIKGGVLPILAVAFMVSKRENVAVYEHGTYLLRFNEGTVERLAKNPDHFKLKWFSKTRTREALVRSASEKFGLGTATPPTMLSVVSHVVGVARVLPVYAKRTKRLDSRTLAVRDAILNAREPDVLLFDDIPRALGMNGTGRDAMTEMRAKAFADALHHSITELQSAFGSMMEGKKDALFRATGMADRESLAKASAGMLPRVSDQPMKVFLGAASADIPNDLTWMEYVGLSLTDKPPAEWDDSDEAMFGNKLAEMSAGFKRIESLMFSEVSGIHAEPSAMVTVTYPDGSEKRVVLPIRDEKIRDMFGDES